VTVSFNLVEEPWIPVRDLGGGDREVSLAEALTESHLLQRIGGDIPTQEFAITRLLLAVVRRAIDWGPDPVGRWRWLWDDGELPAADIKGYLAGVRDRFDLLHATTPFYQVADLQSASDEAKSVEVILADVPANQKHYSARSGTGLESLSMAEAARWVVHCQACDVAGIKSADVRDPRIKDGKGYGIGAGWAGRIGGVIIEGTSLFETLMLNCVVEGSDGRGPAVDDLPAWERPQSGPCVRGDVTPTGPADLLTWQSRRIRLIARGFRIVEVVLAQGDPLDPLNRWHAEAMTGWRYSESASKSLGTPSYMPAKWDPGRAMWRGIEALLTDVQDSRGERAASKAAGVVHWLRFLQAEDHLDPATPVRPHAYGLAYDSKGTTLTAAVDDQLLMRVSLLGEDSVERVVAAAAVRSADVAVSALGALAEGLALAAGGGVSSDSRGKERVRRCVGVRDAVEADAFFLLDGRFRAWLKDLGAEPCGESDLEALWHKAVRVIVGARARQVIDDAGIASWTGRHVEGRWFDTPTLVDEFWRSLREALPYAFPTSPDSEEDPQ